MPVAPATHSVVVAPPATGGTTLSAGHVVMNGKTYASMEEAVHDYHGTAGHAAYTYNTVQKTTDAPVVVEAAPPAPVASEEVQQDGAQQEGEEVAAPEPEKEKKVRQAKPTKKGCC